MAVSMAATLPDDPAAAAQRLYAELHRLDAAGLDIILLESPPAGPEWDGIRDRLTRASAE
jgi:L-threonylcarbamoyladenylate synthase